ncbi:MAG: DUF3570 domain-containing protein [Labilithrix sp.]
MRVGHVVTSSLLALGIARPAFAEGNINTRASSEVAGYTDSVGVSVLTPSVGAVVENPIAGWSANGRYLVDVVTAASPDIVATASPRWTEVRQGANLGGRYKPGLFGISGGGFGSYSNDYLALGANVQLTEDLDDKNLTLVQGYSYGHDTIGRTGTPFSVFSRELTTHGTTLGFSRVINPSLVIGLYGDAIFELGNQSKPYRYVPMFSPEIAPIIPRGATAFSVADARITAKPIEQLPLSRERFALTGRLGWRTERTTVRLDQRLYADTWALLATTTDFRWFVDLGERTTIWPHLRVHVQKGVDFWKRAYVATSINDIPMWRTGDRELGPLSNFGAGAGVRFALGKSGSKDDFALQLTGDGTWTTFTDALYVKNRFSGLATAAVEVAF